MISYNLAPIPIWPLRDNQGDPLENGYMLAYRDLVRSDLKPVYQDPAGVHAYLQPIVFNAAGFQGPFYWSSDENYYLEIYDSSGNLVKTISAYNAPSSGGSGPITIVASNRNYIPDSQFRYITADYSPVPPSVQLGASNWIFQKNNTTAVDSVTVNDFILGSSTPPSNPPAFLQYDCSVAGTGEAAKRLYTKFQSVYSFQNTEVTFAFWAQAQTAGTQVKIGAFQNFGTGVVSPPVNIFPFTFNLTTVWAQYSGTFTVPSVAGKTIGGGVDFFAIGIEFPYDSICQINLTNMQLNLGNTLEPFDYYTPTNNATLQIPFFDSGTVNRLLSLDMDGFLNWNTGFNTGYFFTGSTSNVPLTMTPQVIPINPGSNPENWIAGNRFTPTSPCCALVTACCSITTAGGGPVEIEIILAVNGTLVSSQSDFLFDPGDSIAFTIPMNYPFNGTGDYFEILGRYSGSGDAFVAINFLTIKTL